MCDKDKTEEIIRISKILPIDLQKNFLELAYSIREISNPIQEPADCAPKREDEKEGETGPKE